jgi:hypothetical protein
LPTRLLVKPCCILEGASLQLLAEKVKAPYYKIKTTYAL